MCANDDSKKKVKKSENEKREKHLMKINLHLMKMEAFLFVICDAVCDAPLCWTEEYFRLIIMKLGEIESY